MNNIQCKRHKYEFKKNVVNTTMRISSTGTHIKYSNRGIYICSVCGKQHVGQSQYRPESLEEGAA
ncbi:hypothetical protein ABXJ76_07955 [Methylobacter sp. G7]|uniref:hypothetical protein n=1 Tax=Methylobacter sp. G7 TaxID=3230117 RepID=UPI003D8075BE